MEYIDIQFGTIKHTHTVHNICYLKYYKASWCVFILHFNEDPSAVFASSRTWCLCSVFHFDALLFGNSVYKQQREKKFTWKNNSIRLNFLRVSSWACNSASPHLNFLGIFSFIEYTPRVFLCAWILFFSPFSFGQYRCVYIGCDPVRDISTIAIPNWVAILSRTYIMPAYRMSLRA